MVVELKKVGYTGLALEIFNEVVSGYTKAEVYRWYKVKANESINWRLIENKEGYELEILKLAHMSHDVTGLVRDVIMLVEYDLGADGLYYGEHKRGEIFDAENEADAIKYLNKLCMK